MDAGTLPLQKHPEDVRAVLEDAVNLQRPAPSRSVRLEMAVADDVPPVAMDRHRVLELLGTCSTTRSGSPPRGAASAWTRTRETGAYAVDVSDTGPGIAIEQQAHVFDRFWQGSKTRRAGAGLGLAIAKGIADAHQGSLRVESRPGCGATFTFVLPLHS